MSAAQSTDRVEALFQKAKAYLMSANKDGVSVYDQLTRVMEELLDHNPDDLASDPSRFTEVFALLQRHSFVQGDSTTACQDAEAHNPEELDRLRANRALFEELAPTVETKIEQVNPYTTVTTTTTKPVTAPTFDSVADQAVYWACAGCGLPQEEALLLDRSITKLSMEKNLQDVRFVGKIFGTQADYIVISSRWYLPEGEKVYEEVNNMPKAPRRSGEVPMQPEPGYVGVNRLSYWVTAHPAAPWALLPDITPAQVNAARKVKRLFTGNLDAEVVASPAFPGNEAVYLRAQLTRILSGTFIAPRGAMEEPEEEDDMDDEDEDDEDDDTPKLREGKYRPVAVRAAEFGEEPLDVTEFASLEQWVHAERYLYETGRQTQLPEKMEEEEEEEEEPPVYAEDEEDEEAEEPEEEEPEEEVELFVPIQQDFLYGVVTIPQPPPPMDDEEFPEEEEEEEEEEAPVEEDNEPRGPMRDEDVDPEDVTRMKVSAWTVRVANNVNRAHAVAVVRSQRWPGAVAYLGEAGKRWGCVYFGTGLKKTDFAFTPAPAPLVQPECKDLLEAVDPTAAMEKLIRRGEEVPEPDSENDMEEDLEEEEDY